jgi:hypothetical protein
LECYHGFPSPLSIGSSGSIYPSSSFDCYHTIKDTPKDSITIAIQCPSMTRKYMELVTLAIFSPLDRLFEWRITQAIEAIIKGFG